MVALPYFCRSLVSQALNHAKEKSLKGADILKAAPDQKGVTPETEAIVFHFDPVKPGHPL